MALTKNPRSLVTGAGGGLGRSLCVEIARRGGRVLVSDIDAAGAEETAALVRQAGGEAHVFRCDVSDAAQVAALAAEADARLGGVDLVVNNAGVAVEGFIGEIPLEDWRWLMGVNLWGPVHVCHEVVPRLRSQGRGHILNVASAAGLIGSPRMAPYSASKFALVGLSEALAGELSTCGVGVTVLCPTFFRTNIHRAARGDDPQVRDAIDKLMDASKLDADAVARFALDACARGDLYALPQNDARWIFRLKRLMPQRAVSMVPGAFERQARSLGVPVRFRHEPKTPT